jgi:hypothetical protein
VISVKKKSKIKRTDWHRKFIRPHSLYTGFREAINTNESYTPNSAHLVGELVMKANFKVQKHVLQRENPEKWAQEKTREADAREINVQRKVAQRGYRLMHRRNGQYWVMLAKPMTLPEIETLVGMRHSK